mgnify:CR=1 FL=1
MGSEHAAGTVCAAMLICESLPKAGYRGGVRRRIRSGYHRLAYVSLQATPHAEELAMQCRIVQLIGAPACQYHDVDGGELMLLEANGFASQPFQAVAIHGSTDVLLAEDQAETGVAQSVGARQGHKPIAMYLECSVIEDKSIIPGSQ